MIGTNEPRIKVEPTRTGSDGEDAALLMQEYGNTLDKWQRDVVDCWLGYDEDGTYTTTSAGLAVPRQNGKNVCLEAREFFGLIVRGERILHTAHQVATTMKSFRRLAALFTDKAHPEIMDCVKQIRYQNGAERIELENGGTIEYIARTKKAARGFDGISLVIFDEAQELKDEHIEAIIPTLSASATGYRQIIYTGTPPYAGTTGEAFRRRRDSCLTNPGKHEAWHEWSVAAESLEIINLEDRNLWYMTNPALGVRLSESFIKEELGIMSMDGFARERLGWWCPVYEEKDELALDAEAWDACKSTEQKPEGKTAYGVKFSPDGSEVCLCGAVVPDNGPARISLIERKPTARGTQWLADWLNQRYKSASCVVIDGRNGVDVLVEKIADTWKAKDSIVRPTAKEVVASVGTITNGIAEKTLTWYSGQEMLRESATTAVRRPIGGGWGFGGVNSTPIEACALALWGAKTAKRNPLRKMRIG